MPEYELTQEAQEFLDAVLVSTDAIELLKLKAEMDSDIFNLEDGNSKVNDDLDTDQVTWEFLELQKRVNEHIKSISPEPLILALEKDFGAEFFTGERY